jgi:hypothetical protein
MANTKKEASKHNSEKEETFVERRKAVVDRRVGLDRRRGPGHRRTPERRAAEEGEMNDEQFEFLMAIDQYKRFRPGRRCWRLSERWAIGK